MSERCDIPSADPLPKRFFTGDPGIGGRIKVRPEDFVVEELPLYEPSGEGEHLYLRIQKSGVAHGELVACLRRHFGVPERAIGYGGMKDKRAVTAQTVSIHLPQDPPSVELAHERIRVLWAERHRNKIRRGHLRGNRFSIRIRDVDPVLTPRAHRVLEQLRRVGAPAYFGEQRFGYRHNNHRLGVLLLRKSWRPLLDELLGAGGAAYPPHQQERRELYDAGKFEAAREQWTVADRAERIALGAMCRKPDPRAAVTLIGRTMLSFWASATISAVFNRVLDCRVEAGTERELLAGDLAWKHDSRAVFPITEAMRTDAEIARRLRDIEISPSGPLWGRNMTTASGPVAALEEEALSVVGADETLIRTGHFHPDGARRPLRAPIDNVEIAGGFDEHGPFIRTAFDLPRGAYATVVLREIMKTRDLERRHADRTPEATPAATHGSGLTSTS